MRIGNLASRAPFHPSSFAPNLWYGKLHNAKAHFTTKKHILRAVGGFRKPPLLKENGGEENPELSETTCGLSETTEELKFKSQKAFFCQRIVRNHRKTIAPLKFTLFLLTFLLSVKMHNGKPVFLSFPVLSLDIFFRSRPKRTVFPLSLFHCHEQKKMMSQVQKSVPKSRAKEPKTEKGTERKKEYPLLPFSSRTLLQTEK